MQYFILECLGNPREGNYCFAGAGVEGLVGKAKKFLRRGGASLKELYPEDPYEVEVTLDEDSKKHIVKGDYTSAYDDTMMISQEAVEELQKHNIGEVEFWPFTLINHKGREHSKNYRFVVPVQQFDAIHEALSEIDRTKNGIVIGVDRLVLDNEKLNNAPDMFRVNDTGHMAFSKPLKEILEKNYTNFVFEEAEQA